MLANVFSKTVQDRWVGMTVGTVSLVALLFLGMIAYQDIGDLSLYQDMPESLRSLMGIPADADVASLAYNAILGSYGAFVIAGLAISIGAAAIAGEERQGSMGILLSNPLSRTKVLLSKAGSLVLLVGVAAIVLWASAIAMPTVLDVDITGMHVGAFVLHLGVSSLFYGVLALAIGAWTGRNGLASGTSAGVMVLSFLAVGLLPLVDSLANLAKVFPWYYFSGSDPLINGIDWLHIAVLLSMSVLLVLLGLVGLNRRDLRGKSVGTNMMDRLRSNSLTHSVVDRLAGSARVSRIWVKTASEHQALLFVIVAVMFVVMGVMMGPIYTAVEADMADLGDAFPEAFLALVGGGDLTSPEGFYQLESFGMMAPIAVMIVTIVIGAGSIAGEEQNRSMGLLLANPVSRTRVLLQQTLAMTLYAVIVGVSIFAGVSAGSLLGGLDMDYGNIAATSLLVTLIGLAFGALALLLGAATGKTRVAVFGAAGAALVFHVINALGSINDAGYAKWSPFHYYLGSDPLVNGMAWADGLILAGLGIGLAALAIPAFNRRDLR